MTAAMVVQQDDVRGRVQAALARRYSGYLYAYPHKSAYRPLAPAEPLGRVWAGEHRSAVSLYLHVPFCEMRCGFCNLFTTANPAADLRHAVLAAMARELTAVAGAIGPVGIGSVTIGGGTPTLLTADELAWLFDQVEGGFGVSIDRVPASIETSPLTATAERLDLLAVRGFGRISIGAQSFHDDEASALGRPQRRRDLEAALDRIRARAFRTLNIDLIYGTAGQTPARFVESIAAALAWAPEEIFLYPLYVRPLTGLAGRTRTEDAHRLALYRAGRDHLRAAGYRQHSMRMFRRTDASATTRTLPLEREGSTHRMPCAVAEPIGSAGGEAGTIEGGVIGVGCGARSRTLRLHYGSPYAVGRGAVLDILRDYAGLDSAALATARVGVALDRAEQMRRAIALPLLCTDGIDLAAFERRFGITPADVVPELDILDELELIERRQQRLVPTVAGLEYADAIGPMLISATMGARMAAFEHR